MLDVLAIDVKRNGDGIPFVPNAVYLTGAHCEDIADAKYLFADLLQFGLTRTTAVVQPLEELILFRSIDTCYDGPCSVIVRRGASMG